MKRTFALLSMLFASAVFCSTAHAQTGNAQSTTVAAEAPQTQGRAVAASYANTQPIRIIVMGEDSDPNTIRRNHDIYKRTIAEMRRPMRKAHFDVMDEEIIAADLGFSLNERRPKLELVQTVKLANRSLNMNNRSRFLALFRVHVFSEKLDFAKQVMIRLDGEVYDLETGAFVDSFEIPETRFPVPVECNKLCMNEKAGEHARDMGGNLGEVLSRQLSVYVKSKSNFSASAVPGDSGMLSSYTLRIKGFKPSDLLKIVGAIREDFEGTRTLELEERNANERIYRFETHDLTVPLDESIGSLMIGAGFDIDTDISVSLVNQTLSIEMLGY